MQGAAKVVLIDKDDKYLLLYRNQHPVLGDDPDIPGGIVEVGESFLEAVIREAQEEIGFSLEQSLIREVYSGTEYSEYGISQSLFIATAGERPEISISWEHADYEWLDRAAFLHKAKHANDTFMHMVYSVINAH